MLAIYILASYLLLTAADILLCLAILERAMAADKRQPRRRVEPLWVS